MVGVLTVQREQRATLYSNRMLSHAGRSFAPVCWRGTVTLRMECVVGNRHIDVAKVLGEEFRVQAGEPNAV